MSSRSASRTCLALHHVAFESLGTLKSLFRGREALSPYIQAGASCLSVQEGLTGDACELTAAGTNVSVRRAAFVRNGKLLAGRAALCMNEWMEGTCL